MDGENEAVPERRPESRLVSPFSSFRATVIAALLTAPLAAGAQATKLTDVPLPPPPPGTKKIEVPLPPPPPGTKRVETKPAVTPAAAAPAQPATATLSAPGSAQAGPRGMGVKIPSAERCLNCHAALTQRRVLHAALEKQDCMFCHRPVPGVKGKCQAKTSSKWSLSQNEPDLCYGCHARLDQKKSVHTAVRQGSCLSCHVEHSSNFPGLMNEPREKVCLGCHDVEPLLTKVVKHAPVAEGLCLDCHNPHGSDLTASLRGLSGSQFCLRCHDAKAPTGRSTPGSAYRIDLSLKLVHPAMKKTDCTGCHDGGHGSDNVKMLKKAPPDLCYGCHKRVDTAKFMHSAVVVGDCSVCHAAHSSNQPKLLTRPTLNETCFICHQDDVTGRKVIHKPVAKSCDACHDAHGAPFRKNLKKGPGKQQCYSCHEQVMDAGKVKHPALERYGCSACHDSHGTGYAFLLPKKVNALCAECHPGQKDGLHVSPVVRTGHTIGGAGLRDPRRKGHEFSCASCHNPHGSDFPMLFYYGTTPMESCDACHGDKSGQHPELKNIISESRPRSLPTSGAAGGAGAGGTGGGGAGSGGPAPGGGEGAPGSGGPAPGAGDGAPAPGSGDGIIEGGALEGRGH